MEEQREAPACDPWRARSRNTAALRRDRIASIGEGSARHRAAMARSGLDPLAYFAKVLGDLTRQSGATPGELWEAGVRSTQNRLVLRAFRSLDDGRGPDLADFFRDVLNLPLTSKHLFAFYDLLARSDTWRHLPIFVFEQWLRVAVQRHAQELDEANDDRQPPDVVALADDLYTRPLRPDESLAEREALGFLLGVVNRIKATAKERYRERDARVLDLLVQDFEPAEIQELLGVKRSAVKAVQQRAGRVLAVEIADRKRKMCQSGDRIA